VPWLIDTDIFVEGEGGDAAFVPWLAQADGVATADIVRGEFLLGVHAVRDAALRQRGARF
jgi:predicted nucleic acid-binding protein